MYFGFGMFRYLLELVYSLIMYAGIALATAIVPLTRTLTPTQVLAPSDRPRGETSVVCGLYRPSASIFRSMEMTRNRSWI